MGWSWETARVVRGRGWSWETERVVRGRGWSWETERVMRGSGMVMGDREGNEREWDGHGRQRG